MLLLSSVRRALRHVISTLAILSAWTLPNSSWADQTNLLTNQQVVADPACIAANPAYPETCLPANWFIELPPTLKVTYSYGIDVDGQNYVDIHIVNTGAQTAMNLYFQKTPTFQITAGASYTVSATARMIVGSTTVGGRMSLFNSSDLQKFQPGENDYQLLTNTDKLVSYTYTSGTEMYKEEVSLLPMLGFWAVAANSDMIVRLKAPSLTRNAPITNVNVLPLSYTRPSVAPGKVLKLTVNLLSRPVSLPPGAASVTSVLALYDRYGRLAGTFIKLPGSIFGPMPSFGNYDWGAKVDLWQFTLPTNLPVKNYSIRWGLVGLDANGQVCCYIPLTAGAGVVRRSGSTPPLYPYLIYPYEIGKLKVNATAGIHVGQHFHRIPGNSSGASLDPGQSVLVPYHVARTHDSDNGVPNWWKGVATYDWTDFDAFVNYHSPKGHKKLLLTFFGTPQWASARPNETSPYCSDYPCGMAAEPAPEYTQAYSQMVTAAVTHYKDRIMGVECWNEPAFDADGNAVSGSFFSGTSTALADVCKSIYVATKAVRSTIPVYCPQAWSPDYMATTMAAKTSQGEPIGKFCDVIGAHLYGQYGLDTTGKDFYPNAARIADAIKKMRAVASQFQLKQPLAITEWGIDQTVYNLPSKTRGDLIYQTLATAQELGVTMLDIYSYDGRFGGIWRGGWDVPNLTNRDYDDITAARVKDAFNEVGRPAN